MELLDQLQLAALYHASLSNESAETVFSIVDVDDFEPGHQQEIASTIVSLLSRGGVEQMAVANKASEKNPALFKWFLVHVKEEYYSTATYCANAVRDAANRRRIQATLTRHLQRAEKMPPDQVLNELLDELQLNEAHISSGLSTVPLSDVLDAPDDLRPWIMPEMLRTNERIIVTGPEGGGKSVLVAQMCLGAAMGVNTMDAKMKEHDPMRVLMLT